MILLLLLFRCQSCTCFCLPDPTSIRPITIRITSAISFPKVKVSWMRVAHFTLPQFINMVSAEKKSKFIKLEVHFFLL